MYSLWRQSLHLLLCRILMGPARSHLCPSLTALSHLQDDRRAYNDRHRRPRSRERSPRRESHHRHDRAAPHETQPVAPQAAAEARHETASGRAVQQQQNSGQQGAGGRSSRCSHNVMATTLQCMDEEHAMDVLHAAAFCNSSTCCCFADIRVSSNWKAASVFDMVACTLCTLKVSV